LDIVDGDFEEIDEEIVKDNESEIDDNKLALFRCTSTGE
jgi:hypothetical protein